MLYEVITLQAGGQVGVGLLRIRQIGRHRITSYNVCYTKLLRALERIEGSDSLGFRHAEITGAMDHQHGRVPIADITDRVVLLVTLRIAPRRVV